MPNITQAITTTLAVSDTPLTVEDLADKLPKISPTHISVHMSKIFREGLVDRKLAPERAKGAGRPPYEYTLARPKPQQYVNNTQSLQAAITGEVRIHIAGRSLTVSEAKMFYCELHKVFGQ